MELAQEESNNLSNTVHADNVRLEREVAFLKAVMDETQKARERAMLHLTVTQCTVVMLMTVVFICFQELHSTRGVLAGERARTFQLQVNAYQCKSVITGVFMDCQSL
jgi:hypothetical protein